MSYNLFIDDERNPPDDNKEWIIVRNYDKAIETIKARGCPSFISFDHDLGYNEKTGMDIAKSFVEMIMNKEIQLNPNFTFYVHSQNPIGKRNIEMYIEGFLNVL